VHVFFCVSAVPLFVQMQLVAVSEPSVVAQKPMSKQRSESAVPPQLALASQNWLMLHRGPDSPEFAQMHAFAFAVVRPLFVHLDTVAHLSVDPVTSVAASVSQKLRFGHITLLSVVAPHRHAPPLFVAVPSVLPHAVVAVHVGFSASVVASQMSPGLHFGPTSLPPQIQAAPVTSPSEAQSAAILHRAGTVAARVAVSQ
jgi:hypothetical protein